MNGRTGETMGEGCATVRVREMKESRDKKVKPLICTVIKFVDELLNFHSECS